MSNFVDKISGSICSFNHFSVLDITGIDNKTVNATINKIRNNLISKFKKVYFKEEESEILRDINIAQSFLHASGLPFGPKRAVIADFKITHETLPITDSAIMVTMFPEIGTVSLALNINFENATTDEVVFLKHCLGNDEKFNVIENEGAVQKIPLKEVVEKVRKAIDVPVESYNVCSCMEINKFGEMQELDKIFSEEIERIYGLLTSDEGWEYVSHELAISRLSEGWGSRKFVKFVAFGSNFLLFNLNESITDENYEKHQEKFMTKYYNSVNPYFKMKAKFAGLNHGILFSIETVMAIKTVTNYILDKQTFFKAYQNEDFSTAIKRTKEYRKDLMLTLNKIEQLDISELGELENLVLRSQNIDPIVEKIKYLLELLESDLTLMYSQQTNKMVNILTIVGILLSVASLIVSIMQF